MAAATLGNSPPTAAPHLLEWGKSGGSGRLFIEIRNIFPGEAVPGEELLQELRDLGCGEWGYFYLQ